MCILTCVKETVFRHYDFKGTEKDAEDLQTKRELSSKAPLTRLKTPDPLNLRGDGKTYINEQMRTGTRAQITCAAVSD